MKYLTTIFALGTLTVPISAASLERILNMRSTEAAPIGNYCGKCVLAGAGRLRELRTSVPANRCNTLPDGERYGSCINQYCGVCLVFKDRNCQGDIIYWGGPGAGSFDAKGPRSYYCL